MPKILSPKFLQKNQSWPNSTHIVSNHTDHRIIAFDPSAGLFHIRNKMVIFVFNKACHHIGNGCILQIHKKRKKNWVAVTRLKPSSTASTSKSSTDTILFSGTKFRLGNQIINCSQFRNNNIKQTLTASSYIQHAASSVPFQLPTS